MARKQGISPEITAEDVKILIRWLRAIRDWSQEQLAAAVGIDRGTIIRYEAGAIPPRRTLEALVSAVGLPVFLLDACLLPVVFLVRRAAGLAPAEAFADLEAGTAELERCLSTLARPRLAALLLQLTVADSAARRPAAPSAADWHRLPDLWERFESCSAEDRRFLLEHAPEFRDWTLVVQLCAESAKVAAHSAKEARELAELARHLAGLVPGGDAWRSLLRGYAEAFVANALRVGGDLKAAEACFVRAWTLWQAGTSPEPDLLPAWRLFDLEAALCAAKRDWTRALFLHDNARDLAPAEAAGRILLNRSATLVLMGQAEQAIEILREAATLVDGEREPRLFFALRFNFAADLGLLHRFRDAELLLPEVWQLAAGLGNRLDLGRCLWLQGQIAAGLGHGLEAEAAFRRVLAEFTDLKIAYDAALVALELSVLYLEQGRTGEVRELVEDDMLWIFAAQGVAEETAKALAVFREAALQEAATAELARRLVTYLAQGRCASGLPFEP
ncbi:MAG TPA: helix-turn-helix transcriptional regulator [Thermoanaerobaculia bacterium]|nr:helix-turn-helix transcriptional regulator [Thermoanaerobaculia bacterium]